MIATVMSVSSCSGESYSATFEALLESIEASENRLENGLAKYETPEAELVSCLATVRPNLWLCEAELAALNSVYLQVLPDWNFTPDKAQMQSLRMPKDKQRLSDAREAYMDHLDSWSEYLEDKYLALPGTLIEAEAAMQAAGWLQVVFEERKVISETFKDACSALGDAQPANSDEFRKRIVDVCDD